MLMTSSFTQTDSLEVIFSDRHIVAVNKPAGIPVGSEDSGDQTLLEMVRAWHSSNLSPGTKGYCVPIHFLDRPVSGVIIFALSSKAASRLNEMFRKHALQKVYIAAAEARPRQETAMLEHWLVKDRGANVTRVASAQMLDAKRCELSYRVLAAHGQQTFIEVRPITGRSHQIRVQMSAIGCPLFGDKKYGARAAWNNRVALHAARLEIKHPVGGTPLRLVAKLPDYWLDQWPTLKQSEIMKGLTDETKV